MASLLHSTKDRNTLIQHAVLSWFVRYKCKVALISINKGGHGFRYLNDDIITFGSFFNVIGGEIDLPTERDEPEIIKNYQGTTILVQHMESHSSPCRLRYAIIQNSAFLNLKEYVERNTLGSSTHWQRQIAISTWLRTKEILYKPLANPLPLHIAVNLLEEYIIMNVQSSIDSYHNSMNANRHVHKRKIPLVKRNRTMFTRRTRSVCSHISKLISASSRSKEKIQYTSDSNRHRVGQAPKLTAVPRLLVTGLRKKPDLDERCIANRIDTICQLEDFHSYLIHREILSPRDRWEEWIDNFKAEEGSDPAFMCLLIIMMSSSTSDNQLAHIVPRLFSAGSCSCRCSTSVWVGLFMFFVFRIGEVLSKYRTRRECCRLLCTAAWWTDSSKHNGEGAVHFVRCRLQDCQHRGKHSF